MRCRLMLLKRLPKTPRRCQLTHQDIGLTHADASFDLLEGVLGRAHFSSARRVGVVTGAGP